MDRLQDLWPPVRDGALAILRAAGALLEQGVATLATLPAGVLIVLALAPLLAILLRSFSSFLAGAAVALLAAAAMTVSPDTGFRIGVAALAGAAGLLVLGPALALRRARRHHAATIGAMEAKAAEAERRAEREGHWRQAVERFEAGRRAGDVHPAA